MSEDLFTVIYRALYNEDRALWLDPEDAADMAKDARDAVVALMAPRRPEEEE